MKNLEFLSNVISANSLEKQLEAAKAESHGLSAEYQLAKEKCAIANHLVRLLEQQISATTKN